MLIKIIALKLIKFLKLPNSLSNPNYSRKRKFIRFCEVIAPISTVGGFLLQVLSLGAKAFLEIITLMWENSVLCIHFSKFKNFPKKFRFP